MTALMQTRGRVDLQQDAQWVLQTIADTGQKYADAYLIRILRGDTVFDFQEDSHVSLPTFGKLSQVYSEKLKGFIQHLEGEGLLTRGDDISGKLMLTKMGETFLQKPSELIARVDRFRPTQLERLIQQELREVRRHLSKQENVPPFRIFTDYMLQSIMAQRPQSVQGLSRIPGFGTFKVNRYGAAILQGLSRAYEQSRALSHDRMIRSARNRAHQLTKSLYEAGLSEGEIAERREIKPVTVRNQLITLHRAGEINLAHWIESQLDSGILEKGVSFFESHEGVRLRTAYEKTGLDYDTLRLCRLYVSQVSQHSTELPIAMGEA